MSDSVLVLHFSTGGMDNIATSRAKPQTPSKEATKCKTQTQLNNTNNNYNTTQTNTTILQHNTCTANTHTHARKHKAARKRCAQSANNAGNARYKPETMYNAQGRRIGMKRVMGGHNLLLV